MKDALTELAEVESAQHKGMRDAKTVVFVELMHAYRQWPTGTGDLEEAIAHQIIEELNDCGADFTALHMD